MTTIHYFHEKNLATKYKVLESFKGDMYEPVPDSIRILGNFIRLDNGSFICPVYSIWPGPILGTGLNFIQIGETNICKNEINAYRILEVYPSVRSYIPSYRCKAKSEDKEALLFSLNKTSSIQEQNLQHPTLGEVVTNSRLTIADRREAVYQVVQMLLEWNKTSSRKQKNFMLGEYLKIPESGVSPIPVLSKGLSFYFDEPVFLSNPIVEINNNVSRGFNSWIGIQNGRLTGKTVFLVEKPLVIGWQDYSLEAPLWEDLASLELDLLISILTPLDHGIWLKEWKYVKDIFDFSSFVLPNVQGNLLPVAMSIISPIRQSLYDLTSGNQIDAYCYAAIKAGLRMAFNPYRTGPERLAALFYLSVVWNQINSRYTEIRTEVPTSLIWPGFRSWQSNCNDSKVEVENVIGTVVAMGTGVFGQDSNIPQLQSVLTDLNEFSNYFRCNNFEVYPLIGKDFKFRSIKKNLEILNQLDKNKPLWVLFCGHGIVNNNSYCLLTYDSVLNDIANTTMGFNWLISQIADLKFKNTIYIINSCYSGQTISEPLNMSNFSGSSVIILSSASPGEKSYSLRDDPFSIFVGTCLEGISILENQKKKVTIFDFLDYVTNQVPQKAIKVGQLQHPIFYISNLTENFSINARGYDIF